MTKPFCAHAGLYTDFYEFTMAQAYLLTGNHHHRATFDYFFRQNPFDGGYVLFAGMQDLLEFLEHFRFDEEDLEFLRGIGLDARFLEYLRMFRFAGTIAAAREGEVVFPFEPVVRVEGNIIETQLIETILLNILNFESLIATKAARLRAAAGSRRVVDFGLRRAQGLGGVHASRAAVIGGVDATSNLYAACAYGLEVSGTQAHSWIQSFPDELTAFRKFAEIFPSKCFLLVDTYDTLRSGIPNAIIVARELERAGHRLLGVRLDSGDLAYLSKHARRMLDEAGFSYVKIVASNQLDEYVIRSLLEQGAPIDAFGVGTRLITGAPTAALDGVYKLSMYDGKPRLKFSENFGKLTLPGSKTILRYLDAEGNFLADGVCLDTQAPPDVIHHPLFTEQRTKVGDRPHEKLLTTVMTGGKRVEDRSTSAAAQYARERLALLSPEHRRFENPHTYRVGISGELLKLRSGLLEEYRQHYTHRQRNSEP
jgi:nicotinate phosphoribosyltransferase